MQEGHAVTTKDYVLPSKDAVEYGRNRLTALHAWLKEAEAKYEAEGKDDERRRWRFAAYIVGRELGQGGCVIATFDERWLDDDFRTAYASAVPAGGDR